MATLGSLRANFKVAEGLISEIALRVKESVPGDELDKIRLANEELKKEVAKLTETLTMIEVMKGQEPTFYTHYMTSGASTPPVVATKIVEAPKTTPAEAPKGKPEANTGKDGQKKTVNKKGKEGEKKPDGNKDAAVKPAKPKGGNAQAPAAPEVLDVGRLDFRVGKIVNCEKHPEADALYLEKIEVGEPQPRTVISGLVKHVPLEEMQNRMVVLLCNLKPQKMRGILSEAMVMCASTPEKVEILSPPASAVPGDVVEFEGITRNPDLPFMNPKKKIFETVAPDLKTNDAKVATYKGVPFNVPGKGLVTAPTLSNVNIK